MKCKQLTVVLTLIAFAFPLTAQAGPFGGGCHKRNFADFLNAQGAQGSNFFTGPPPFRDILGWGDAPFVTFGIGDYAGVWDADAGGAFGTKVKGSVVECALGDGRVLVRATVQAQDLIAFAQSAEDLEQNDFDFNITDTIFGKKPADVVNTGAQPALGESRVGVSFAMPGPGLPFPDLIDVIFSPTDFAPVTLNFRLTAEGERDDGTKACMQIIQVAAANEVGELVFTKEVVDILNACHR